MNEYFTNYNPENSSSGSSDSNSMNEPLIQGQKRKSEDVCDETGSSSRRQRPHVTEIKIAIPFFVAMMIFVLLYAMLWFMCRILFVAADTSPQPNNIEIMRAVTNGTMFKDTDNICFHEMKGFSIDDFPQKSNDLQNLDHCEQVWSLGRFDYVYACLFDGEHSIVFTTIDPIRNTTNNVGLAWKQFCMLMHLSDELLDDINFIVYRIK